MSDNRVWVVVHARVVLGVFPSLQYARKWRDCYCGRVQGKLARVLPLLACAMPSLRVLRNRARQFKRANRKR